MNTPTTQTSEVTLTPFPVEVSPGLRLVELWDQDGLVGDREWALEGMRVLGRGGDTSLLDRAASREHCRVQLTALPDRALVVDLGSHNGTYVNGLRVSRALLRPGDVLRVGRCLMTLDATSDRPGGLSRQLGARSAAMVRAVEGAGRMAAVDLRIVILGETGVGKQVLAEALHRLSALDGPFVPVNCARLERETVDSELFGHLRGAFTGAQRDRAGLIAQADGGTLFLDEIGELPLESQTRLLRVLDDRVVRPLGADRGAPVDFRLICATNVDLEAAVARGSFRSDLYHRLVDWVVRLPPLHQRVPDLPAILSLMGHPRVESLSLREALACQLWPGNVRTLAQVARRLRLADGADWQRVVFPTGMRLRSPPYQPPAHMPDSAEELVQLMACFEGNISAVARHLGRAREVVYRALVRHRLREPAPDGSDEVPPGSA